MKQMKLEKSWIASTKIIGLALLLIVREDAIAQKSIDNLPLYQEEKSKTKNRLADKSSRCHCQTIQG